MNKTRKEYKSDEESLTMGLAVVLAEGIGCLGFAGLIIFLWIGLPILVINGAKMFAEEQRTTLEAERYSIEGAVASIEVIERVIPEPDENEEPKRGIHISISLESPQFTRVTFEDGRVMDFDGMYSKPMPLGEYIVINYDGLDQITSIKSDE